MQLNYQQSSFTVSEKTGEILGSLHTPGIQPRPKEVSSKMWDKLSPLEQFQVKRYLRRKNKALLYYLSTPHTDRQENEGAIDIFGGEVV